MYEIELAKMDRSTSRDIHQIYSGYDEAHAAIFVINDVHNGYRLYMNPTSFLRCYINLALL